MGPYAPFSPLFQTILLSLEFSICHIIVPASILILVLIPCPSDIPVVHDLLHNPVPAAVVQIVLIHVMDPATPSCRCPAQTPGQVSTNAAFLIQDHICKKFADGWHVHVPLTFLTNKGCLMKDRPTTTLSHDVLTIDSATGQISTASKPLSDDGELDLSFDEWHQAWHRLLDLIRTYIPNKFLMWEIHYSSSSTVIIMPKSGHCTLPMMQRFGRDLFTFLLTHQKSQLVYGMT